MALTDPIDTLAYHQSRTLTQHRDMGHIPCKSVADAIQSFMDKDEAANTCPETEALWFYGLNHGYALVQQQFAPLEPLPSMELKFIKAYYELLNEKAVRAFYYLVLICTRESRHVHHTGTLYAKMQKEGFSKAVTDFNASISGGHSNSSYKEFLYNPPKVSIGEFCRSLQFIFYKGSFGGAFGGPAWGAVADCLVRFVNGEYSAEMMLDTVWTLCHNNGPIFNKGMLYGMYGSHVVRILDVQRSGQIPEMILSEDPNIKAYLKPAMIDMMNGLRAMCPGKIGEYVDWHLVEGLGAVGQYPHDKANQIKKHGPSQFSSQMEQKKLAAEKAAVEKAEAAKAEKMAKEFEIMPGMVVQKVEMVRKVA